ncbi:hypothetical protein, partial [Nocardia cyriacigeorgica]|uniref:hypothetical protein n=1 Tax=Nocardia cyriacigeorgica TaxID=135487 RepID=UPI0018946810
RGFSDPTRTHVQWSIHVSLPDEDEMNVSTVHQLTPPLPDPAAMTQVDTEVLALRHDAVAPARAVAQAALAYLCAEPDIAPANTMRRPARTAGPAAPKQRSKAATLFGVGYRVGPTLPGRRRERRDHTEHLDHTATRRSPEPHP